ncbi:unnamed protein product [Trypanosoma congolense IL3000]|uniref:WGS project CAEQ00000000 data, annotated contig 1438 n=1 Tax=Trypanosoma congolense (strain IL3000) TaxID=1068625 RepID=F9W693_TRYCI|nr:unnamed protein product [Trypanosoma congolense IL3000]
MTGFLNTLCHLGELLHVPGGIFNGVFPGSCGRACRAFRGRSLSPDAKKSVQGLFEGCSHVSAIFFVLLLSITSGQNLIVRAFLLVLPIILILTYIMERDRGWLDPITAGTVTPYEMERRGRTVAILARVIFTQSLFDSFYSFFSLFMSVAYGFFGRFMRISKFRERFPEHVAQHRQLFGGVSVGFFPFIQHLRQHPLGLIKLNVKQLHTLGNLFQIVLVVVSSYLVRGFQQLHHGTQCAR